MNTNNKIANRRLLMLLIAITLGMFGFGFAMVPLYNVICKTLGVNGKTSPMVAGVSHTVDKSRTITVEFITTTNEDLPWEFYSKVKKVKIHPGENMLVDFYAKNNSPNVMTVQAIPSVSPGPAAEHLKKTECFCFARQTFKGGEQRKMPVLFHLDTDLPSDIHTVTLSYTMFDIGQLGQVATKKLPGHIQ